VTLTLRLATVSNSSPIVLNDLVRTAMSRVPDLESLHYKSIPFTSLTLSLPTHLAQQTHDTHTLADPPEPLNRPLAPFQRTVTPHDAQRRTGSKVAKKKKKKKERAPYPGSPPHTHTHV